MLRAQYVLCDSWFTCAELITAVREIGGGAMHIVGLAKMDKTRYTVNGVKRSAKELVVRYSRDKTRSCRKYKCCYIALRGMLGQIPMRIFLIKYGRSNNWTILLSSDVNMPFIKAFEIYQISWNIEILFKECKQHLGLGSYHGRDFYGQVDDCTICFLVYTVMALHMRFSTYETMGRLFADMEEECMALTLWRRILAVIEKLIKLLCDRLEMSFEDLAMNLLYDEEATDAMLILANLLESKEIA